MAQDPKAEEAAEIARSLCTLTLNDDHALLDRSVSDLITPQIDPELLSYVLLELPATVVELAIELGAVTKRQTDAVLQDAFLCQFRFDQGTQGNPPAR